MEFNGTFELEGVSAKEVWLALSDPVMIKQSLPGCQFLVKVEDEVDFDELREQAEGTEDPPVLPEADPEEVSERAFETGARYATIVEMGVGSVKPSFETIVTIDKAEFPEMLASGEGSAASSSFEMESGMTLEDTEDGVTVNWWAEPDVFGRIAQMGQRVINPVANRVVQRFFNNIAEKIGAVGEDDSSSLRDRIRDLV
ncbi:MAG: CoxG family protein [Halobacteriota archaeon]